jgi:hypothetical protein
MTTAELALLDSAIDKARAEYFEHVMTMAEYQLRPESERIPGIIVADYASHLKRSLDILLTLESARSRLP